MADTESAQIEAQLRELRTQFRDKALDVIRNKLPQKVVALQALFSVEFCLTIQPMYALSYLH